MRECNDSHCVGKQNIRPIENLPESSNPLSAKIAACLSQTNWMDFVVIWLMRLKAFTVFIGDNDASITSKMKCQN